MIGKGRKDCRFHKSPYVHKVYRAAKCVRPFAYDDHLDNYFPSSQIKPSSMKERILLSRSEMETFMKKFLNSTKTFKKSCFAILILISMSYSVSNAAFGYWKTVLDNRLDNKQIMSKAYSCEVTSESWQYLGIVSAEAEVYCTFPQKSGDPIRNRVYYSQEPFVLKSKAVKNFNVIRAKLESMGFVYDDYVVGADPVRDFDMRDIKFTKSPAVIQRKNNMTPEIKAIYARQLDDYRRNKYEEQKAIVASYYSCYVSRKDVIDITGNGYYFTVIRILNGVSNTEKVLKSHLSTHKEAEDVCKQAESEHMCKCT